MNNDTVFFNESPKICPRLLESDLQCQDQDTYPSMISFSTGFSFPKASVCILPKPLRYATSYCILSMSMTQYSGQGLCISKTRQSKSGIRSISSAVTGYGPWYSPEVLCVISDRRRMQHISLVELVVEVISQSSPTDHNEFMLST